MDAMEMWDSEEFGDVERYLELLIGSRTDQSACEALTEFAHAVIRDQVGSDHLARYLEELLSVRLTEPHASCRQAVAQITRCCPGLEPCDVADCLLQMAHALRGTSSSAGNRRPPTGHLVASFADVRPDSAPRAGCDASNWTRFVGWIKGFLRGAGGKFLHSFWQTYRVK